MDVANEVDKEFQRFIALEELYPLGDKGTVFTSRAAAREVNSQSSFSIAPLTVAACGLLPHAPAFT